MPARNADTAELFGALSDHEDQRKALSLFGEPAGPQAYRQLAQVPPPAVKKVALLPIVERVAFFETRLPITIAQGPDVTLVVDPDQIEQMLINLIRNAVEAVLEPAPVSDAAPVPMVAGRLQPRRWSQ